MSSTSSAARRARRMRCFYWRIGQFGLREFFPKVSPARKKDGVNVTVIHPG